METPFVAVIPARLSSTRLPRKPLADIGGAPMVVRVAEQAAKSAASRVVVATDSDEIMAVCQAHRIEVVKTKDSHPTGTDRLSELVSLLGLAQDEIVVNVQGDEPFIPPQLINQVAQALSQNHGCAISTAAVQIEDHFEVNNPNVVKVVCNLRSEALYFSRAGIPFARDVQHTQFPYLRHLGIYAYRVHFLQDFANLPPAPIEQIEALEQLRALYNGYKIHVQVFHETPPPGIDTPEDLKLAQLKWAQLHQK
ncbi:3-deoxy-manno-octulosonate cytidylyltransferase [Polynucleobacter sp. SHI8]|uniref:3-deoxy-manno-octulosonate cytidylyltransferase n=1 Tax=unclassified Polynucleobacter TaxID=2640945 RepID=UPI0024939A65|nr:MULTISPECIES: 3-deoxy-manno-octulosonate cytidylyltransferase [unclassified Polynucleobacter]BDW10254.1 3-deoxy-manno-octulosonate cytidylyltransferase [Polynucleobacter sp. SHI2]BDW12700.1 3-deoxy-manno-octulosonate cytidylyltransferase [Polynucleobacter sp. SHI8]